MYQLRSYQQEAVQATLHHFRQTRDPAVIVLPTGAGKSLVIAELARLAKGRVLVLAHVKELVEQNHAKYLGFGLQAGIFSAGLQRKDSEEKVIFGSIQSIARAPADFFNNFSLLVIDECHRVSVENETQYFQVIDQLRKLNPNICVLGLTATPYRLGQGWIYQWHKQKKIKQTDQPRFFKTCIYELSIAYLIKNKFLTAPIQIDSPVACYDFSSLKLNGTRFVTQQIEALLKDQKRITPIILKNIVDISSERKGVMIFTSSVAHAKEILQCLPEDKSALIVGDTANDERDQLIESFKQQKLKYLVNVSVLTTGFDAPHVDVIAILRPTESVSLYQQIVGRGLRLSPDKVDCLILDYTGQSHNIFSPEIEDDKPVKESVAVEIICPQCGNENNFWGIKNAEGEVTEHFGRTCKGYFENPQTLEKKMCGFRFRFKRCDKCHEENDIAARVCSSCQHLLVDNDKKLKEAMALKDAYVMRVESMFFQKGHDKRGTPRLEVKYYDADAQILTEYFYLNTAQDGRAFYFNFIRMHSKLPERKMNISTVDNAIEYQALFRIPAFVIARKQKHYWNVKEKIFD